MHMFCRLHGQFHAIHSNNQQSNQKKNETFPVCTKLQFSNILPQCLRIEGKKKNEKSINFQFDSYAEPTEKNHQTFHPKYYCLQFSKINRLSMAVLVF